MNKNYKRFCERYKEKLVNDKDIEENDMYLLDDYRERIWFTLNVDSSFPTEMIRFQYSGQTLITLDLEDLEYFYNKYSKRVKSEMEENIEKVKNDYKSVLNDIDDE